MQFTDEWLVHTIEPLLPDGTVAAIRAGAVAPRPVSLWEIAGPAAAGRPTTRS